MSNKCPEPVTMPDGSVSIRDCIDYLNDKYGTFDDDTPRELEVAKLWGFSADGFDEKALFIDRHKFKREEVKLPDIKGSYASCKINLAQAPNGYWAVDSSIMLATTGCGASPSIWSRIQYPDRLSAINAELDNLMKYCKGMPDIHAGKMLKILTKFKADQNAIEHPDLFG